MNQINANLMSLAAEVTQLRVKQLQQDNTRTPSTTKNKKAVKKVDRFTQTTVELPSCSVCFEEFSFSSDPRVLFCGHSFCSRCISRMRLRYSMCPLCKSPNDFMNMQHPNFLAKEILQSFRPCGENSMTHSQRRQKSKTLKLRLCKENVVPISNYNLIQVSQPSPAFVEPLVRSPRGAGTPDTWDTESVD